jgi:hypothetical protein
VQEELLAKVEGAIAVFIDGIELTRTLAYAEERSIVKSKLKLSGWVKANAQGFLQVRNHIYRRVFGSGWVAPESPVRETNGLKSMLSEIGRWLSLRG